MQTCSPGSIPHSTPCVCQLSSLASRTHLLQPHCWKSVAVDNTLAVPLSCSGVAAVVVIHFSPLCRIDIPRTRPPVTSESSKNIPSQPQPQPQPGTATPNFKHRELRSIFTIPDRALLVRVPPRPVPSTAVCFACLWSWVWDGDFVAISLTSCRRKLCTGGVSSAQPNFTLFNVIQSRHQVAQQPPFRAKLNIECIASRRSKAPHFAASILAPLLPFQPLPTQFSLLLSKSFLDSPSLLPFYN